MSEKFYIKIAGVMCEMCTHMKMNECTFTAVTYSTLPSRLIEYALYFFCALVSLTPFSYRSCKDSNDILSNESGDTNVDVSGVLSNSLILLKRGWLVGLNNLLQLSTLPSLGETFGTESDVFPELCG